MKKLLLTTLLIFGTAIVHGQDKMQFSIIGGYEHFKKENPHNQTAGYGLGCEFKYYFYNRLYALANFHAGIYNEFTPRTAMAEIGEVDFSMHWRTREYKGGAGMGIDLLKTQRHNIYTQATFGLAKLKQSVPVIHSYRPTVEMGTKNTYLLRYATSISIGYDYQVSKSFSIGLNYTGWWVADVAYRNTLNAKIGYNF